MATIQQSDGAEQTSGPVLRRYWVRLAIVAITIVVAGVGVAVVFARGGGVSKKANTDGVVATLHLAGRPNGIAAAAPGALWVSLIYPDLVTSKIERLDLATGAVQHTVLIKGIASATIRAGDSLWVGSNRDFDDTKPGSFRKLDWNTGAVKEIIPFDRPVFGIAYGGGSLWFVVGRAPATLVRIDPVYFRPTEVDELIGDASKARQKLGWKPKTTFAQLVKEMVASDLNIARREAANGKNPV